ncbi:MAG: tyrosine-type recombinase/integrase [Egibacteraceae bacterium]
MKRSRIELTGPLAVHAAGFQAELERLGYTASPAKKHCYLLAHLSCWLDERGLDVADVATSRVEPFFAGRRAAGVANLRTRAALAPLIAYLRGLGVVGAAAAPAPTTQAERFLDRFRAYLTSERGLVEGTVRFYVHIAGLLVNERATDGDVDLSGLSARDVTAFSTRVCEGRGLSSCRQAVSALRSFLRFLALEGVSAVALDDAVLAVAGWDPSLPRAISSTDVARLLNSCDRRRTIGRRDYAILLLLARLGLRGGEVVAMELGDVDWRAGELTVRGKGRRQDRLPLPVEVGEALAGWLTRRPTSASRRLFLRCVAPFVGLADTGALRSVLARACARAGLCYVSPHRLRHTTATELLRSGAALTEIGQVLRHTSSVTTAAYAKVDHNRLRIIARPWPRSAA